MKIRFHWGTGIALVFALFVFSLVYAVIKSRSIDHALVRDDYYTEDIHYQEKHDKVKRTEALGEAVGVQYIKEQKLVMVYFPRSMSPEGEIQLYRASDASLDRHYSVQPDSSGVQFISVQDLKTGYWKVKVDWTSNGLGYYMEEEINIQ